MTREKATHYLCDNRCAMFTISLDGKSVSSTDTGAAQNAELFAKETQIVRF
jgi:hypothetical protein